MFVGCVTSLQDSWWRRSRRSYGCHTVVTTLPHTPIHPNLRQYDRDESQYTDISGASNHTFIKQKHLLLARECVNVSGRQS
jgi:hypothetical protein